MSMMKSTLLLLLVLLPVFLAAQEDSIPEIPEIKDSLDVFSEMREFDGISISPQVSYLVPGNTSRYPTVGLQLNDYFGGGFFVRNRYMVGSEYFKFSTAELSVLLIRNDLVYESSDLKTSIGMTLLTGMLFIFNDGVGYSIPVAKGVYVSPFISPFEIYFTRKLHEKFSAHCAITAGSEISKTWMVNNLQIVLAASGEAFYEYQTSEIGYRLNFSVGIPISCW